MATKHTFRENVLRIIAVLGLIAVLLLGAWGIIQLAFFIPSFLSNIGNGFGGFNREPATETLTVAVPLAVTSGTAFPVSWTHKNQSGQYSYALSYSCAEGLTMQAILPNGSFQTVQCNTPFNYVNAASSTGLTPMLTGTKNVPVTVTVAATKLSTGAVTATATANATVAPSTKTATTTKPATTTKKPSGTTTKYVASGRTTNLYGYPDLAVRITQNPGTVRAGTQVSLQFVVENVGTNVTPRDWVFSASLPYNPVYTFQSQGQQALYPGDKIVYTLGYTAVGNQPQYPEVCTLQYPNPNCPQYGGTQGWSYPCSSLPCNVPGYGGQYPGSAGSQTASVMLDPYNLVWEASEGNNNASTVYSIY